MVDMHIPPMCPCACPPTHAPHSSGVKVQDVLLDPNLDGGLVEHKLDQRLDFDSPEFQSQPPK